MVNLNRNLHFIVSNLKLQIFNFTLFFSTVLLIKKGNFISGQLFYHVRSLSIDLYSAVKINITISISIIISFRPARNVLFKSIFKELITNNTLK